MSSKCGLSWLNIPEIRAPTNGPGYIVQYNRLNVEKKIIVKGQNALLDIQRGLLTWCVTQTN